MKRLLLATLFALALFPAVALSQDSKQYVKERTGAPSVCPPGTLTIDRATGIVYGNTLGACTPVGSSGLPVSDSTAFVKGSSDATKLVRIEADGITAGTTRVWTAPDANTTIPVFSQVITFSGPTAARTFVLPDANSTLATLAGTETFTNKTLTAPTIGSFANATHTHADAAGGGTLASATGLPISTGVSGLGTGVATFLGTPSSANLRSALTDESGTGAALFAGGNGGAFSVTTLNGNTFTAGTYTLTGAAGKTFTFNNTLTFAGTDSTTMTFPSTTATIARTDAGQTFSGTNTFGVGTGAPLIINGGGSQNVLVWQQAGTDIGALSSSNGIMMTNGRPGYWTDGASLASFGNIRVKIGAGAGINGGVFIGADNLLGFHSATSISGSPDTGLSRNAAGVMEVNSGTAGTIRDLRVRNIITATSVTWSSGTGSPESVVTANVGSLYTRTDGGASTTLYVKESGTGNTGWVAK